MALGGAVSLVAGWREARRILDASRRDFVGSLLGSVGGCAAAAIPSLLLRNILPVPESLLAVVAAAIVVTLCFVLGWLALDRELRSETTQWWSS
jgi:drug/metabolite transporter (DMT)-like permease